MTHALNLPRAVVDFETKSELSIKDVGAGRYAYAELTMVPTQLSDKKYISFYMNTVKFVKSGERLGSGGVFDKFAGTLGGEEDYNPGVADPSDISSGGTEAAASGTAGDLDDEIPF